MEYNEMISKIVSDYPDFYNYLDDEEQREKEIHNGRKKRQEG